MYLITFGDDWTLGTGAWYKPGMPKVVYDNTDVDYESSWRMMLLDYYGYGCQDRYKNFASSKSSNQKQFALAKQYFSSKDYWSSTFKEKNKVVLWGLTTTRRDYKWCNDTSEYEDIIFREEYDDSKYKDKIGYGLNKWCHNDRVSVKELQVEILHWNQYFKALGIKNYWFDTFSSKPYTIKPPNFLDIGSTHRDLLSLLCIKHAVGNRDSSGGWVNDKFEYALNNKLINPHDLLPKKEGHQKIFEYFVKNLPFDRNYNWSRS
jgi:hypothetical protein|tara:strand:- start:80 stop:865 length:786 start_codon:yes stop_codon:yes gene_type:complete